MHPLDEQYNKLGFKQTLDHILGIAWDHVKASKGYETEEQKKEAFQHLINLVIDRVAQFKPILKKETKNGN